MDEPALPYANLTALRAEHLALLREWRASEGRNKDAVLSFRQKIIATGTILEQEDDRRAAQDILEYWSAQLLACSESITFPDLDLEIMPFAPEATLEPTGAAPPAPSPPAVSPLPSPPPPSPSKVMRRTTRLNGWLFWSLVFAAWLGMIGLLLAPEYLATSPGPDVGGDESYDSLHHMIAGNVLVAIAVFGLIASAALALSWRHLARKRLSKSAAASAAIDPREQIRLSALARQWRESDYLPGYLLTGVALAEASAYRRNDPEIEKLVAASEAAERRTLFIRRGFFAVSFLLILLAAAASYLFKETEASRQAAEVARRARVHAENQTADARIRARKLSDLLNLAAQDQADSTTRIKALEAELSRMKALLADARNTLGAVTATPPQAEHQKTASELAATLTQALDRYDAYTPPAPAGLTTGQQLLVSTGLIDSPDETQRDKAVRQLKDALQGGTLPTSDQVRICDTMVGMLMHPSVDGLTQTGLANLLEVLAAVPPGKWGRPDWSNARAGARRAAAWLLDSPETPASPAKAEASPPAIAKEPADGGERLTLASQKLFTELKHNIGLEPAPNQLVFLQFTAIPRDDASAVGAAMIRLGWHVQGAENVASAVGVNEVRYGSQADGDTAALLVGDLRKYGLVRMKLAPMNPAIKAGTLEVWFGEGADKGG